VRQLQQQAFHFAVTCLPTACSASITAALLNPHSPGWVDKCVAAVIGVSLLLLLLLLQGITAQIKAGGLSADKQRHPYDLGIVHNAFQVLGDEAAPWCIPSSEPTPGGLAYPTFLDGRALGF
jgi:hypothetical protein